MAYLPWIEVHRRDVGKHGGGMTGTHHPRQVGEGGDPRRDLRMQPFALPPLVAACGELPARKQLRHRHPAKQLLGTGTAFPESLGGEHRVTHFAQRPAPGSGSHRVLADDAEVEPSVAYRPLHDEIRECKPKVIVCFGKAAFDLLIPMKIAHGDALGGWFYSELHNARVILLDKPSILLRKPERLEDFRLYFREIKAMIDRLDGVTTAPSAPEMHFIETMADLRKMVDWWKAEKFKVFCTDCEWGKGNFLDRNLRSAQFAWSKDAGCAVCFLNERGEYIFDATYEEAGAVLCEVFNDPEVKFVGHYISVDLPWLAHLFGVEWYDKVLMDTAFAMQTCDESAGMGLEMVALTYTGFGRYDIPLMLWHKAHKGKDDDGFARIPDEILRPYSIYDVCVPMHALPHLQLRLKNENLERYYYDLLQPFVTNVFTHFVMKGLPMDIGRLDDLRQLYQFAKKELNARFQKAVAQESWMLLARRMREVGMEDPIPFVLECKELVDAGEG